MAQEIEALKQAINKEMEALRDLEREKFSFKVRHQELSSAMEMVHIKETNFKSRTEAFHNEIKEGVALVGSEILSFKEYAEVGLRQDSLSPTSAITQEELKKKIERLKKFPSGISFWRKKWKI